MTRAIDTLLEPALWFLADWSLRWAALIVPMALVVLIFRPRRAAMRQLMGLVALIGGLLVPVSPRWGNGWYSLSNEAIAAPISPVLESRRENPPQPALPISSPSESVPAGRGNPAPTHKTTVGTGSPRPFTPGESIHVVSDDREAIANPRGESWGRRRILVAGLALCWSAGVLLLLLRWGCGWWFLRSLRRGVVEMPGPVAERFAACRAELNVSENVRLAAHPLVRSPLLLGLFRPLILVPLDWPQLSADVQRGGLLHELAHVRRRDHWLAPLLHLLRVSFFFHPLVRWLLSRLEYERELLCDETVIQRGIDRHDYTRMLLEFARASGRFALPDFAGASYLPMGRRRTIKTRIHHLLEEDMERWISPLPTRWVVILGTVLLSLMLGLASYRVLAVEPAEAEKPTAAKTNEEKAKEIEKAQAARTKRESLRYGGKNFDQWRTDLLTELKAAIRVDGMKAFAAFGANGYGAEATQAILEIMRGYDVTIEYSADDDAPVVKAGYKAIDKIGPPAVPALTAAVKEENRNVRRFAIKALGDLGTDARSALPALLQAIKNDDDETRGRAVKAVMSVDPHIEEHIAVLIEAVKSGDQNVRFDAIQRITQIGRKANSAIPALLKTLADNQSNGAEQMHHFTVQALIAVGARKEAVAPVSRLLQSPNALARSTAYQFLQSLGADAVEAVPALLAVVKQDASSGSEYRSHAFTTLRTIGPAAKAAVPVLEELLKSDGERQRNEVKATLKKIEGK